MVWLAFALGQVEARQGMILSAACSKLLEHPSSHLLMKGTTSSCLRHRMRDCLMAAVLAVGKDANMDYAVVEAGAQYICPGCLAVKGMVMVDLDIFGSSGCEREKKFLRICCPAL
jgi:hypothetical protein